MTSMVGIVVRGGVLAAGLVVLSACATLNEDQCRDANWQQLGYDDGQAGRHASHIDLHRQACQRHNLPIQAEEWRAGWEIGIRQYCTPQNGLNEGRAGRSYANSCPDDLRADFEDAYRVAKAVHDARSTVDRENRAMDELLRKLRDEDDRAEARKLQTEISVKRDAVRSAERRLRDAERDYDFYLMRSGARG
jgi:hypothetical protein